MVENTSEKSLVGRLVQPVLELGEERGRGGEIGRGAGGGEEESGRPVSQEELDTAIVKAFEEPAKRAGGMMEEAIPARMLNEFVYCARLFYYEHVEGVFVSNADTERGRALHKKVDSGSGSLAPARRKVAKKKAGKGKGEEAEAEEPPETIHSRSVFLGSQRHGSMAKMDLIEGERLPDGRLRVTPVDYKSGEPMAGEDGNEIWDADRIQLGVQALVLRENGYVCDEAVAYYRKTKQRVRLTIDDALERWITDRIAAARTTMAGPIPAPLDNSPKCARCSLVSVCLPDETRSLASALEAAPESDGAVSGAAGGLPVRRLIAARDDCRALYLNTQGYSVGISDRVLKVKEPGTKKVVDEVRLTDLHHVALFGNIQLTTQALRELCYSGIPVTYFSTGGYFYGMSQGMGLKNVFTRIEQFRLARDPATCLDLARSFVRGKIRNHRTLLMRNHVEPPPAVLKKLKRLVETAGEAPNLASLLGTEGAAAAHYFGAFPGMIKAEDELDDSHRPEAGAPPLDFDFATRNRRPPTDPVNALLSFAYSMLAKDCTIAALSVGFDPYVGFYHQPRFGRPALALDLMEEFRPLVAESAVLTAINNRAITPRNFIRAGKAVNLSASGRKAFLQIYERRMAQLINHPVFDYKVSYRRAIELQFRLLARTLTGEIPEYIPFRTR